MMRFSGEAVSEQEIEVSYCMNNFLLGNQVSHTFRESSMKRTRIIMV